ncbi:uncharacterized protein LOC120447682 isoform X2 [Drosophila santomea]|uniref:uncharacterized protein LOC120447682 isoform X2 n=1 Tax=Drosophila santomea TaxID=129105 RepID=UPI001CCB4E69|nr:uncharacterized protein LOC120447682 isoform X2 [Drosophila santomea]
MCARVCLCIFANKNITVLRKQPFVAKLAEKRADLTKPIVFKQRVKQPNIEKNKPESEANRKSEKSSTKTSKTKKPKAASSKLSFNEDEEDETSQD